MVNGSLPKTCKDLACFLIIKIIIFVYLSTYVVNDISQDGVAIKMELPSNSVTIKSPIVPKTM